MKSKNISARINDILEQFYASINTENQAKLEKLERKIKDQKNFLNMVVHDLRNPSESIHEGLKIAKELMDQHMTEQIDKAM